jgi:DNA ligase (NAD+)
LGIRNVGEQTSLTLAENFGIESLKRATLEDLQKLQDIGPVAARSIYEYFHDQKNKEFLTNLEKAGVETEDQKAKPGGKLKGLVFVLTGVLENMSREEAKKRVREQNGIVSETVSKKTNFVVTGTAPGSKFDRAKNLNVKIIGEAEFLEMLQ